MYIDLNNEVHLMWIAGAFAIVSVVSWLAMVAARSFIDRKVSIALKANTEELNALKADIAATNQNFVSFANQMFANINQLTINNSEKRHD